MWTAFGIMLGFIAGVVFGNVKIPAGVEDTRWRMILGSTAIPPIFVCAQVHLVPESPRWYMSKGGMRKLLSRCATISMESLPSCDGSLLYP